jgi:hypothetical protein
MKLETGLKFELPISTSEHPCLSADRDTSFDNDKRHFPFNHAGSSPMDEKR